MASDHREQAERPLVKPKIVATVGPASDSPECIGRLIAAGVDVFRLNFAHGTAAWRVRVLKTIREQADAQERPIAVLGDLSGPKIRLGQLPEQGLFCSLGARFTFVRQADPDDPTRLTSTYDRLIDDLVVGDRVLLADGTVAMRVVEKNEHEAVCRVEQAGSIRSRQGINLPGVALSVTSPTAADLEDLQWALEHNLDFVGLSFVRSADEIRTLRRAIETHAPSTPPWIVAKIEKSEAIENLDEILIESDAVMVARGDLGVEMDIAQVPVLQKRIIRACNRRRVPVITATQMLESMQSSPFPTRAEASDVANAVFDGTDALMLSGETAVGGYPVESVAMMSRIAREAEQFLERNAETEDLSGFRRRALEVTEAVARGAAATAVRLGADLIAVCTHSGRTALAMSNVRSPVPILALSDRPETARRMCLFWGVTPMYRERIDYTAEGLSEFVAQWGQRTKTLRSGSRVVLLYSSDWSAAGHDAMLVHVVP